MAQRKRPTRKSSPAKPRARKAAAKPKSKPKPKAKPKSAAKPVRNAKPKGGGNAKAKAKNTRRGKSLADRTKAKADAAGATGPRVGVAKTALRNTLIVARVLEGWTWEMIAQESGVSIRQSQRVWKEHSEQPSLIDAPPVKVIEDAIRTYRQSMATFSALAASADNTSAAVGAIKARNEAQEKIILILQAIGHVPHDLGTLKVMRDVEQIATGMFDAVNAFKDGNIDADELADRFADLAGIPRAPAQLPETTG